MNRPSTKVVLDLGNAKRRRLLEEFAQEKGMTLQDMMLIALRKWLDRQEEEEGLRAIEEVENEPTRPIEELLAELGDDEVDLHEVWPGL